MRSRPWVGVGMGWAMLACFGCASDESTGPTNPQAGTPCDAAAFADTCDTNATMLACSAETGACAPTQACTDDADCSPYHCAANTCLLRCTGLDGAPDDTNCDRTSATAYACSSSFTCVPE